MVLTCFNHERKREDPSNLCDLCSKMTSDHESSEFNE